MQPVVILVLCCSLALAAEGGAALRSLVQQAQLAEQQDRLDDAVQLYKKVLGLRPGWASAELNLGLIYHSRGDYSAAIRTLSNALRHQPNLHSALLFRGASYLRTANPVEAVRDAHEFLRRRPNDPEGLSLLAEATLSKGDPGEAAVAFAALGRVTRDAAAWYRLHDSYARLAGNIIHRLREELVNDFRAGLTSVQSSGCEIEGDTALTKLRCTATAGDLEAASRALLPVVEAPIRTAPAAARLGNTLSLFANLAVAKVLATAPDSGWAALLRAQAADETGQVAAAEREYQKAIASGDAVAEMHVRYGQFQCKRGQLDEGLRSYERALQLDSSTPGIMGLIGEVHLLQNRPERAIEYLREAIRRNAWEAQSRLYLAQALNQIDRAAEAAQLLEAAPQDSDGRMHYVLGRTYMKLGETEKSRKAMDVFRKRSQAFR